MCVRAGARSRSAACALPLTSHTGVRVGLLGYRAAGSWVVVLLRKILFGLILCYQKCFAKA